MTGQLVTIITSPDAAVRDRSVDAFCRSASLAELLAECAELDAFRRTSDNLYERVRALFFLYNIHRFHLPRKPGVQSRGFIPFDGYSYLLPRRFEEAIDVFLKAQAAQGPNESVSSALAEAYHRLGFQTLADQVRRSVRSVRGNQWMFRIGHPADQPLRVRPELLARPADDAPYPILKEATPVRMDLSHSAWSDIFFLGMDYPEGARVLNISIDLGVHGRDAVHAAAGGGLLPGDRRTAAAAGQRGPGRQSRHHQPRRGFRLCPGLPGAAEGRPDRSRAGAAGHGRLGAEPGRSAGAAGGAGPRHRAGEQRQPHPERLAAGRLDESAGLPDRRLYARHRTGERR